MFLLARNGKGFLFRNTSVNRKRMGDAQIGASSFTAVLCICVMIEGKVITTELTNILNLFASGNVLFVKCLILIE